MSATNSDRLLRAAQKAWAQARASLNLEDSVDVNGLRGGRFQLRRLDSKVSAMQVKETTRRSACMYDGSIRAAV